MKFFLPLLLLLGALFSSCSSAWFCEPNTCPPLVRKIDAEAITRAVVVYAATLKHDYRLSYEDGKCYYSDCTEKIRLVFSSQDIIEICEARELITDVVEGLLETLNSDATIRGDLCGQHFTANDVEIYINFESWFCEYIDPFYVGWIELEGGLVTYYMDDVKQWYYNRWHARIEPYAKALEIARAQRLASELYSDDTTSKTTSKPKDTSVVEGTLNRGR